MLPSQKTARRRLCPSARAMPAVVILPLSSPSSPSPPPRPPPSPPRLPPGYDTRPRLPPGYSTRLLTHEEIDEWEEIEREREDREEGYLRMEELDEQDGIGIARWQRKELKHDEAPSLDPTFANVGVSVINHQRSVPVAG